MIAWKRCSMGACCALVTLLAPGCTSLTGSKDIGDRGGSPVSRLPSWDSSDDAGLTDPEILPETHLSAGRLHEARGRLARAAEQYRLAIGLKPDYVEAYNRLGIVLDKLRRFREADQAFARAIELAPNQAYLHNNVAFSYMTQLRWHDAEIELTRALELHPEFARARVNLALVFAQQDRFDEAMTQFQLAVPIEDAHFNMGLMYQSRRRLTDAARAFKAALELNPKMVAAQKRLDQLPPDVVSAAQTHTAVQASPAPASADADQASDKSARPSTQPADAESTGTESTDAKLPDTDSPSVPEPSVPQCLSLSIETSMDAHPSEADEPFWMLLEPAPIAVSNDDEFGPPPLESFSNVFESSPPPLSSETPTETSQRPADPDASPAS